MGIIGSIRKHSWIAVALVGIAIIAFILGDLTKNNRGIPDMGKVNGETMSRQRFDELVERAENNYKMQQQVAQVPSEMQSRIRESVWSEFVEETLFEEQAKELGLQVTPGELGDMYTGKFIHSYLRQYFTNPQTGVYDTIAVRRTLENFTSMDTTQRMQWVELEKAVKKDRMQQKYASLILSGFYMPKALAEKIAVYNQEVSNVRVAAQPFQSVSDDEVTIVMPNDNMTIEPVFADATAVYALDFGTVSNGVIPQGWRCVQENGEVHQSPNSYTSGARTMAGFSGFQGKGLYWRNDCCEYGRLAAQPLTLEPGDYTLTYAMAAWKGSPKYKAQITDAATSEVVAASETLTAAPNANGNSAANLSKTKVNELTFTVSKKGKYIVRFANESKSGSLDEFLLMQCKVNTVSGTTSVAGATKASGVRRRAPPVAATGPEHRGDGRRRDPQDSCEVAAGVTEKFGDLISF